MRLNNELAHFPAVQVSRRWSVSVPSSPSLLFCLGSMPGTLVCSSLRFRQAYWAVPSTTRCDALLPSPSTLSSLLLSLCRGLTLSMLSTSICDTAARRCLTRVGHPVFQDSASFISQWTVKQKLLALSLVGSRLYTSDGESQVAQPDGIFLSYTVQLPIDLKSSCLFPVGMPSIN